MTFALTDHAIDRWEQRFCWHDLIAAIQRSVRHRTTGLDSEYWLDWKTMAAFAVAVRDDVRVVVTVYPWDGIGVKSNRRYA